MPSRAYTSFLLINATRKNRKAGKCQCPLGLISHFYHEYVIDEKWEVVVQCQCPLGLIPHFYLPSLVMPDVILELVSMPSRAYTSFLLRDMAYADGREILGVNALSGLYLISTVPLQKPRFYAVSRACFCRYLSEYSDNSRFSCMLTFWTYLMRCTYP